MSGWRKVCLYDDLTQMMLNQGRFTDGADQGDRWIKVLWVRRRVFLVKPTCLGFDIGD